MRLALSLLLLLALWVEGLAGVSAGGGTDTDAAVHPPRSSCCRSCTCTDRSCCAPAPPAPRPVPGPLARPSAPSRDDLVSPPLTPGGHPPCPGISAASFLPSPVLPAPPPAPPAVPRYLSVLALLL